MTPGFCHVAVIFLVQTKKHSDRRVIAFSLDWFRRHGMVFGPWQWIVTMTHFFKLFTPDIAVRT